MKFDSIMGYAGRYIGGAIVYLSGVETVISSLNGKSSMSTEEFVATIGTGAILYFVGDRIHKRELDQAIYDKLSSIDDKLTNISIGNKIDNGVQQSVSVTAELIKPDGYKKSILDNLK